jgi:hypothetical protein
VRGKYRDVILPMTVLRRLDAVLEPTKQAVLDMKASLDKAKVVHQDQALRQAAGQDFYNTSKFTLCDLKARASQQSNDAFPSREFDFILSNPPYGKSWKSDLERMGGKDGIKDPRFVIQRPFVEAQHVAGAKDVSPLRARRPGTSNTIGSVIRGFKIGVTKWVRANTEIHDLWQRNYYEHVIRDESSLSRIREYIVHNPASWADDVENPNHVGAANEDYSRNVHR